MKTRYLISLLLFALPWMASAQDIIINEVMPANLGEVIDPSWNFGGWIEVYNPSSKSVSLRGMTLSDAKGNTYALTTKHGSVAAKGFKTIWFGHNDAEFSTQVSFKLDCDGGTISLASSTGAMIDAVTYPEAISHCSWARTIDGGTAWNYCAWATCGGSNNDGQFSNARLAAPEVSHPGGWLEEAQKITVTVPQGATLYYTQDGTIPTLKSNHLTPDAEGRVTLDVTGTTVFRFRAIASSNSKEAPLPSAVVTRSFISRQCRKFVEGDWYYDENKWDWVWVDDHYEDITLGEGSLLSVVIDPSYLYDDQIGIYTQGTNGTTPYMGWSTGNYYRDWDRPANAELFDVDASPLFNQEVDMAIAGGYSRMRNPKSFKLKSGKKFEGAGYYPLTGIFPEKPNVRYKDLHVRVGGTDMLDRHQDNALQYIVRQSGMYMDTQAFRPVYVFLNGVFEELLFMREPSNKQYGYSNYGMNTDEMDTLEESDLTNLTIHSGDFTAFNALYAASSQAAKSDTKWEEVRQLIDVDEFANYFAIETFLANGDWPQNNIKLFRDRNEGRFHVVLQDLDACFHDQQNTFSRMESELSYYYAVAGQEENKILKIFLNLMGREEFRQHFVDAFCLVGGSVMEPAYVKATLDNLYSQVSPLYATFSETPAAAFTELRNKLSSTYIKERLSMLQRWSRSGLYSSSVTATIKTSTPAAAILLNDQPIPRGYFSGALFPPVTLKAEAAQGYEFTGWKKGSSIVSTDPTYRLTAAGTYEAVFSPSKKEVRHPVVVNEVSASNDIYQSTLLKRSDWIELYNTTDAPINVAGLYISDDITNPLKHQIPATDAATTTIPAHGHLVLWADDKTESDTPGEIHLPFKLANAEEQRVILTCVEEEWADTLGYHIHNAQQSVGRWPDGGKQVYRFDRPTFGKGNLLTSYAEALTFKEIITGISNVRDSEDARNDKAYDLQGRPVRSANAPRGLIIHSQRIQFK